MAKKAGNPHKYYILCGHFRVLKVANWPLFLGFLNFCHAKIILDPNFCTSKN